MFIVGIIVTYRNDIFSIVDGLIFQIIYNSDRFGGNRAPAGVEGMVRRGGHHCIFGHLGAAGQCRIPAVEGVARAGGDGERAVGAVVGHFFALCADRAAVGVKGHGVLVSFPMGIERAARRVAHHCVGGDLRSAGLGRVPAGKSVARAGGGGQAAVSFAVGDGFALCGDRAAVGVEVHRVGDGLGRDRIGDLPLIIVSGGMLTGDPKPEVVGDGCSCVRVIHKVVGQDFGPCQCNFSTFVAAGVYIGSIP